MNARLLDLVQQQSIIGVPSNINIDDGNNDGNNDDDDDDDDDNDNDNDNDNNDDDDDDDDDDYDNDDDDDDYNDDDSTIPPILYHDIARAGAFHWRILTLYIITSWEQQATYLNTRPVLGLLCAFPHVDLPADVDTMVMIALHIDLRLLCTSSHSSIKRVPRIDKNINKVVQFGSKRVLLQLQTY